MRKLVKVKRPVRALLGVLGLLLGVLAVSCAKNRETLPTGTGASSEPIPRTTAKASVIPPAPPIPETPAAAPAAAGCDLGPVRLDIQAITSREDVSPQAIERDLQKRTAASLDRLGIFQAEENQESVPRIRILLMEGDDPAQDTEGAYRETWVLVVRGELPALGVIQNSRPARATAVSESDAESARMRTFDILYKGEQSRLDEEIRAMADRLCAIVTSHASRPAQWRVVLDSDDAALRSDLRSVLADPKLNPSGQVESGPDERVFLFPFNSESQSGIGEFLRSEFLRLHGLENQWRVEVESTQRTIRVGPAASP